MEYFETSFFFLFKYKPENTFSTFIYTRLISYAAMSIFYFLIFWKLILISNFVPKLITKEKNNKLSKLKGKQN